MVFRLEKIFEDAGRLFVVKVRVKKYKTCASTYVQLLEINNILKKQIENVYL